MDSMKHKIMRLKQALHELECQKQALDAHAIVAMTDPAGKIIYVNDKFCQISQYSREELLGQDLRIVNSGYHSKQFFRNFWKTIAQGKVWNHDVKNRAKDGSLYWVHTTVFPIIDEAGTIVRYVSIRNEITKRKLLEESLQQAKDEAEKLREDMTSISVELHAALKQANILAKRAVAANRSKSDFLADMSHEIRTPMNGVIGFMDMLMDTPLDSEQRECAETAKRSAEVLLSLINNILDLSKIEAGKMQLEKTDFNLQTVVDDVWNLFRSKLIPSDVESFCTISNDIPFDLQGDPMRLHQVLLNLLSNAAKFTEEGKISLTVQLQNTMQDEVELLFIVQDTGIGIAKDRQRKIFEVFAQSDSSISRTHGGSGLGLAIVKKIVLQTGGQIKVESELGKGAVFSFTMPFRRSKRPRVSIDSPSVSPQPRPSLSPPDSQVRVLLAEDNKDNQLLIYKILDKVGHRLDVAGNGKEAVEKIKTGKYDLVLMDVQMPVMDGLEATRTIRQIPNCRIPIVAVTACAMQADRDKCLEAGMDDYIPKPITREIIYDKIDQWVIQRRSDLLGGAGISEKNIGEESLSQELNSIESKWADYPDLKELSNIFLRIMPLMLDQLQGALDDGDMEHLGYIAEKFKSAAFSGGYTQLARQADRIIESLVQSEAEDVARSVAQMRDLCGRVNTFSQG